MRRIEAGHAESGLEVVIPLWKRPLFFRVDIAAPVFLLGKSGLFIFHEYFILFWCLVN
jgi:hypothetical protein